MLLLTSVIWGVAFVAQSVGMDYTGPFTFNGVRCALGALALLPLVIARHRRGSDRNREGTINVKLVIEGSLTCGIFLFIASNLQQVALINTPVGKVGFITAMYIVFVPVMRLALGKRAQLSTYLSVLLAAGGLYLLCMHGGFTFSRGDVYCIICAIFFALQILAVDKYASEVDGVLLALGEFAVCAVLSLLVMAATEEPSLSQLFAARVTLLYAGVCSCGIAYTLQILGQQRVEPAKASLIMCMESPISVLAGWMLLEQTLSIRELGGCLLMFIAIVISQKGGTGKAKEGAA